MKSLIKAENLTKTYGEEGAVQTHALKKASFEIDKGEFVSIMGPSGSGKSTLMQILGLLDSSSGGEFYFEGELTTGFSEDKKADLRNRKIGFIFQSFNLLPRTTVYENVELPLLYDERRSVPQKENSIKIKKALESVGMTHRLKYLSNEISGGEKQRVAIARALVNNPEIIFADEPTGNLDSKSGLQVMKILQELNEKGHTVILVTHESSTAKHAKRMIMMKDGEIVGDKEIEDRKIANDNEDNLK